MGLSASSTGSKVKNTLIEVKKASDTDKIIALAGNPNVGKSTVFNALTGLRQHTGNWAGKTVVNAKGSYTHNGITYHLVDIPGTYSLFALSAEEAVARDFICFGNADAVIVVCDATCLERNLNLVFQTLEITNRIIVCVNLLDEAEKKGIYINLKLLEELLGVPVVGTSARAKKGLDLLCEKTALVSHGKKTAAGFRTKYPEIIEKAILFIEEPLDSILKDRPVRFIALKLLENDTSFLKALENDIGFPLETHPELKEPLKIARQHLYEIYTETEELHDELVSAYYIKAEEIVKKTVTKSKSSYGSRQLKADRFLTNKWTSVPVMLLLLSLVFYITAAGANIPSTLLADGLFYIEKKLTELFMHLNAPLWLHDLLVLGVYRVVAWVVSVMLPPMAIFFPLFTLLEDLGYLPRVAFNLDNTFRKCNACGKQSLTMCMGAFMLSFKKTPAAKSQ